MGAKNEYRVDYFDFGTVYLMTLSVSPTTQRKTVRQTMNKYKDVLERKVVPLFDVLSGTGLGKIREITNISLDTRAAGEN